MVIFLENGDPRMIVDCRRVNIKFRTLGSVSLLTNEGLIKKEVQAEAGEAGGSVMGDSELLLGLSV